MNVSAVLKRKSRPLSNFFRRLTCLLLLVLGFNPISFPSGAVYAEDSAGETKPELILDVSPYKMEAIGKGSFADAIDGSVEDRTKLSAIIYFRIEKVLEGNLGKVRVRSAGKFNQLKEAAKDKKFLKIFTQDFSTPGSEFEKQLFRVAVTDPEESFGLKASEMDQTGLKFRIYATHYSNEKDTFVMIRHEKL